MGLVAQNQQTTFANPQNGQAPDADVVRTNDNALMAKHNAHDADATIHVQTGTLASRPAAGTPYAMYLDENRRLYVDNGTTWNEVPYLKAGDSVTGGITFSGTVAAATLSGAHSGNGSGLTNLPAGQLTGALPAISGASLTSLNGSNIASGTVAEARLPASYTGLTATTVTASTVQGQTSGARAILSLEASQPNLISMSSGASFISSTPPAGGVNQYLNVRIGTTDYRITLVPV